MSDTLHQKGSTAKLRDTLRVGIFCRIEGAEKVVAANERELTIMSSKQISFHSEVRFEFGFENHV